MRQAEAEDPLVHRFALEASMRRFTCLALLLTAAPALVFA